MAALTAIDLRDAIENGLIHEDVMDRLYLIDPEDRPFADAIPSGDASNIFKEFSQEKLDPPDGNNAYVDGMDLTGINDASVGNRFGNYAQQQVKVIRVSERARRVNAIGASDRMIFDLNKAQRSLRRDEEQALVGVNGTQPGDGNPANMNTTGPGVLAGLGAWIRTNVSRGVGGANAVLSGAGGVGGYPLMTGSPPASKAEWIGITPGNARGLTFTLIEDMMELAYQEGGNPKLLHSVPKMVRNISSFMFDETARVATIQTDVPQSNRTNTGSEGGVSGGGVVAQASVNIIVTTYGTVELVPDRWQATYQSGDGSPIPVCNVFLTDPDYFEKSYLQGYQTMGLAKMGLADNSYIRVDVTLCAMAENSSACIADVDPTVAMVA